jgi:hypothetical protein
VSEGGHQPDKTFELVWSWAQHEDMLFINRSNLFTVAEAMLIAAYAIIATSSSKTWQLLLVVVVAGWVFSGVWFYVSWVQDRFTLRRIKERLRKFPAYKAISLERSGWTGPNYVLGRVFPILMILLWTCFLIFGLFARTCASTP